MTVLRGRYGTEHSTEGLSRTFGVRNGRVGTEQGRFARGRYGAEDGMDRPVRHGGRCGGGQYSTACGTAGGQRDRSFKVSKKQARTRPYERIKSNKLVQNFHFSLIPVFFFRLPWRRHPRPGLCEAEAQLDGRQALPRHRLQQSHLHAGRDAMARVLSKRKKALRRYIEKIEAEK